MKLYLTTYSLILFLIIHMKLTLRSVSMLCSGAPSIAYLDPLLRGYGGFCHKNQTQIPPSLSYFKMLLHEHVCLFKFSYRCLQVSVSSRSRLSCRKAGISLEYVVTVEVVCIKNGSTKCTPNNEHIYIYSINFKKCEFYN